MTTFETGIIRGMSNEDYHGTEGVYSSTQLKDILNYGREFFYRKYITKELPKTSSSALVVGNYFHTGVLEPHLLDKEYVVFKGRRTGKKWEEFQEANQDKLIISETEAESANRIIEATQNSHIAMNLCNSGEPEVTCFTEVLVYGGEVFDSSFNRILTINGWREVEGGRKGSVPPSATLLRIKSRADTLILGDVEFGNAMSDLKSTSGSLNDITDIRKKIKLWGYEFSAAMYLSVFDLELEYPIDDWYWIFASKDTLDCRTVKASEKMLQLGRAKFIASLVMLASAIEEEWVIVEKIDEVPVDPYEYATWIGDKK